MRLQCGSTALSSGHPGTQAQPRTQGHSWDFTFGCGDGQGDLSNKILEDEEWASLKMDVFFKTCRCTGRRGYETHVNTSPPSLPPSFLLSFCFHLLFKKYFFSTVYVCFCVEYIHMRVGWVPSKSRCTKYTWSRSYRQIWHRKPSRSHVQEKHMLLTAKTFLQLLVLLLRWKSFEAFRIWTGRFYYPGNSLRVLERKWLSSSWTREEGRPRTFC